MSEVTNDLMLEVLKEIRADVRVMKSDISDLKHNVFRLREDSHEYTGNDLRIERQIAEVRVMLDRINTRLNLVDA